MPGPLTGVSVIEMAGIGPGPFCAMQLADMGASVTRIERPSLTGMSRKQAMTRVVARGARSVAIDLKHPAASGAILKLIGNADVLIEGFRPGVMERLGLGPEPCLAAQPRLVYGRMTGWGQHGPLAQAAGHDINYISLVGALYSIGTRESGPVPPLNLAGDYGGGGLMLAYAIACALLHARSSGEGQVIDLAMVDGAASLMAPIYGVKAAGRWSSERGSNMLDGATPYYRAYRCKDGWISVGSLEPQFFAMLLQKLEIDPAEFGSQHDRQHWPRQQQLLASRFAARTRAEWCAFLEGSDVCFAPILSLDEAPQHPHLKARGTFLDLEGVMQPAPAARFSRTPCAVPVAPCLPGEHTLEALRTCGVPEPEIEALRQAGALGLAQPADD
jgi:alpha-methylacyl-CoA racemase